MVVSVEQEVVGSAVPETVLLEAVASAQAEAAHEAVVLVTHQRVKLVAANQEAILEAAASAVALPEVVVSVEQEVVGSAVPEKVLLEVVASAQAEAVLEAAVPAEKEEAIFQNLTHVAPKALFLIDPKVEHQASVPLAKLNAFYY